MCGFEYCHGAQNTVRPVPPALCVESHQSWTEVYFDRAAFSPKEDLEHLLLGTCILRENHPAEHSLWDFPNAVTGEHVVPGFCPLNVKQRSLHALQISSRASIITPPVELADLRGADLVVPSLPPHREIKWPREGYLLWGRACELIAPLTHPMAFGAAGIGGKVRLTFWERLVIFCQKFVRACQVDMKSTDQ